jgi:hypothetical protein
MSFELPFRAAARQWQVFKVVGRSAVILNVPFFQKFTVHWECTFCMNSYKCLLHVKKQREIKVISSSQDHKCYVFDLTVLCSRRKIHRLSALLEFGCQCNSYPHTLIFFFKTQSTFIFCCGMSQHKRWVPGRTLEPNLLHRLHIVQIMCCY